METMTTQCEARVLSIVRSRKKVQYDERLRARGQNRADQSDFREQGLIQGQGGCPAYQHSPKKRTVNHSRLRPLSPWRALLLQAAMPLDGAMRLPLNLRTSLHNLLTLRCHTHSLLSNWISQDTMMGTGKVL